MSGKIFPVCIFLSLFFISCSDSSKNELAAWKAVNESLEGSNRAINRSTDVALMSLNEKLNDPASNVKASIWQPKAVEIMELSKRSYQFLENLKSEILKEATRNRVDGTEFFYPNDKKAVNKVFVINNRGAEFQLRLKQYRKDMFSIHPHLDSALMNVLAISAWSFDSLTGKKPTVIQEYFKDKPAISALAMLSKFQNDVKIAENSMVAFCNNKVSTPGDYFDFYSAIIGQSSNAVKAGEKMEIIAGVGAFSRAAKPEITINGKSIPLEGEGTATYKFTSSNKFGKHFVPVIITFTGQDGKKQTISKNVEYTVIKDPCPDISQ